jgi:hypothetical protein
MTHHRVIGIRVRDKFCDRAEFPAFRAGSWVSSVDTGSASARAFGLTPLLRASVVVLTVAPAVLVFVVGRPLANVLQCLPLNRPVEAPCLRVRVPACPRNC